MKHFLPLLIGAFVFFSLSGIVAQSTTLLSEDFANSIPAGWTTEVIVGNGAPSEAWVWSNQGPQGSFATAPLASTTAANGWILFDSDLNCNHPDGQDSWIISPAIDATNETEVYLQFETFYRSFNDRPQIRVGTDLQDLANWAIYEVFPGITANDFNENNPETKIFDLTANAAGQTFYIAFQFLSSTQTANGGNLTGCGYAWQVDDVLVTTEDPRPPFDMAITGQYAVAPNFATPVSSVEPMAFLADIENNGTDTMPSSKLALTIINSGLQTVFTDTVFYGAIAPDSIARDVFFDNQFTPAAQPETYQATYEIITPTADATPDDNSVSFIFNVTEDVFSKDQGGTFASLPASNNTYEYGNVYYVVNGEGLMVDSVQFGMSGNAALADKFVTIFMYEWAGDLDSNLEATNDELELLGFGSYTFTGNETDTLISLPVSTFDGSPVNLKDTTYYIATVQFVDEDGDKEFRIFLDDNQDYLNTWFVTDSLLGKPRYASALAVGDEEIADATKNFSLVAFGWDIVPVVRLFVGGEPTAVTMPSLLEGEVSVFPNPTKGAFQVNIELENVAERMELRLMDVAGRVLSVQRRENVQKEIIPFQAYNLPNGTYLLQVVTEQGIRTEQVIINR